MKNLYIPKIYIRRLLPKKGLYKFQIPDYYIKDVMKFAGYKKYRGAYVKPYKDGGSRFHLKILKTDCVELHLDHVSNGKHYVAYKSITVAMEKNRIRRVFKDNVRKKKKIVEYAPNLIELQKKLSAEALNIK